jgi:hypothetical protein
MVYVGVDLHKTQFMVCVRECGLDVLDKKASGALNIYANGIVGFS